MTDVAELTYLADEDERIDALSNAVAARDNFIAAVSHELRNTVAPLILLAEQFEAVGARMSTEQLATKMSLLTRNLHKFVATVDRVTEVAELRDGRLELELGHVDLTEVVADVVRQQRRLAIAGGVELTIRGSSEVCGRWDRARIAQIITNLVANAVRFGVGGEVEIEITEHGDDVEVAVRDHGPGIPASELTGIFDRFDHRGSRTAGGFGVGLFIVKTLAIAMGGHASVASSPDGGASFSVVLPRGSQRA